ncbi:Na+/H+ antiporter subunit E [Brachybacterium vulturis]|uniref:Na+/H+ antiporter subunit E n=1 Tax=Brachybacterium vulturis TaxID=2017484 RepID=UPI003734C9F5
MQRLWYSISYVLWMLGEIIKGSLDVARGVYSRRTLSSPAIVEYPLRGTTDVEIVAMASSITITPGTLVVGTAHGTLEEGPSLFVHALFAESREQVVADLTEMENRLLRATRGPKGADAARRPPRSGVVDVRYVDGRRARHVREDDGRDARRSPGPPRPAEPEEER